MDKPIVYHTEISFEHDEVDSPEDAVRQALAWIRDNRWISVEVSWKDPENRGHICSVAINEEDLPMSETEEETTSTGHVIGATYRSSYWGGVYRVVGHGRYGRDRIDVGVEVECVEPGAGAHQTVGERWSHLTELDPKDVRLS